MLTGIKPILESLLSVESDWRRFLLHNWNIIVGNLAVRMRLEQVHEDTLILGVYDSHWMHELFLLSNTIIRSVNKSLGHQRIVKVRFRLIERRPSPKPIRGETPVAQNIRSSLLTYEQQRALMCVKDRELQESLKSLLNRCNPSR